MKRINAEELYASKKNLYHILYIILISLLLFSCYFIATYKTRYINGINLMANDALVIPVSQNSNKIQIERQDLENSQISLFSKKVVKIKGLNGYQDKVFNSFTLKDLIANENNKFNLTFNIENIPSKAKLIIGYQTINFGVPNETDTTLSNSTVDLTHATSFTKGKNNFISVPLNIMANASGEAYMYIGIEPNFPEKSDGEINYKLSDIRLEEK